MIDFDKISCIFYDFDGVMTDNRVLVDQNGCESVFVNRSDGFAVSEIKKMGIHQAIISTESNPVVKRRGEKLGIPVVHGLKNKGNAILDYASKNNIDLQHTLFIGNDLNDIPAFEVCGMRAAPADADSEMLKRADWISKKKGGDGVVRELYTKLCEARYE